jgi:Protein of unknown function (DUF2848)
MTTLHFTLHSQHSTESIAYECSDLVIAGWAGRDIAAVEHHIKELEAIGVPRPSSVPLFYRVGAGLATQDSNVQMLGADSSGEIEPVIFTYRNELWLTIGSDHTDRKVEAYSVAVSKQMCAKPIARAAWRFADVVGHWDQLMIRSHIEEHGKRVLYQEGPLAAMRTPADLIARYVNGAALLPLGTVMTCGTVGAIGGVRPSTAFAMELNDPVLGRSLTHEYRTHVLPVVS